MLSASRSDRGAWANAAYDVAWRILHDREAATEAAVHGLQVVAIADPASAILIATRRQALEVLDEPTTERPATDASDGVAFVHHTGSDSDDVAAADQAWGAAEAMGPVEASLIDLHLRFGVPSGTLVDELGSGPDEAADRMQRLQGRLEGALASWKIWNDGKPRCEDLSAVLQHEEAATFGPPTGRLIAKHAVGCQTCRATMADAGGAGLQSFIHAPVLQAPTAVRQAAPGPQQEPAPPTTETATVFVDDPEPSPQLDDDSGPGPDIQIEVGGPGLLAGILVGVVIAVIIIAGATAWVLTSS